MAGCTSVAAPPEPDGPATVRPSPAGVQVQAWLFPGSANDPQCAAQQEYHDGRLKQGALKPEYWKVNPDGRLALETTAEGQCNAYSRANVADLKAHSAQQYPTLSGMTTADVHALVSNATRRHEAVQQLTGLAKSEDLSGVDVDLEDFWSWSRDDFADYLTFLTELVGSLHGAGKRLQVDAPPMVEDAAWYDYAKIAGTGVDDVVIMAYDLQFESSLGSTAQPIAPYKWLEKVVRYARSKVPDPDRLVIGLPSYGYSAPAKFDPDKVTGSIPFSVMRNKPGWSGDATTIEQRRDASSGEIRWTSGSVLYDYVDATALDRKVSAVTDLGVKKVSVWTLGGNPWFSH
jgi:spore germination protein YaaH